MMDRVSTPRVSRPWVYQGLIPVNYEEDPGGVKVLVDLEERRRRDPWAVEAQAERAVIRASEPSVREVEGMIRKENARLLKRYRMLCARMGETPGSVTPVVKKRGRELDSKESIQRRVNQ